MYIAIDFDGTICTHECPALGEPIPNALEVIKKLQAKGHKIMLWTMRSGQTLDEAVEYINSNGIQLYGINENPDQHTWTTSPKMFCDILVDDVALGCPLVHVAGKRPYVDWFVIENWMTKVGII